MIWFISILTIIVAYLIGSVNTSIILSTALFGSDIRQSGSGNAGTTNMLRTHGKKMAIFTLLGDVLKGVIAVLLAILADKCLASIPTNTIATAYLLGSLPYIAGFFAVLGHNFPVFFQFKGGKGVATTLGVVLTINWQLGLIVLVIALAIMLTTRYVSLGSCVGAAIFPILYFISGLIGGEIDVVSLIFAAALGLLIVIRHSSNIARLKAGTENKLSFKKEN